MNTYFITDDFQTIATTKSFELGKEKIVEELWLKKTSLMKLIQSMTWAVSYRIKTRNAVGLRFDG